MIAGLIGFMLGMATCIVYALFSLPRSDPLDVTPRDLYAVPLHSYTGHPKLGHAPLHDVTNDGALVARVCADCDYVEPVEVIERPRRSYTMPDRDNYAFVRVSEEPVVIVDGVPVELDASMAMWGVPQEVPIPPETGDRGRHVVEYAGIKHNMVDGDVFTVTIDRIT